MQRYRVFGGVLASPFAFPELRSDVGENSVDWSLRTGEGPPSDVAGTLIGRDELIAGVEARLFRMAHGLRLQFDDTGTFDVTDDGAVITWFPNAGSDRELVRVDILGRVLAVATHERGLLCLHGSAVSIGGQGVAFLAPKGSGKSTLALTLTSKGARLLTDDTLPVDPDKVEAHPGVHSVRLWDDAAQRFGAMGDWRVGLSDKRTFDTLPETFLQHDPVPLAALYELIPMTSLAGGALVRRTRLTGAEGAVTLMTHSKLGALMGGAESLRVFDRCAALASRLPVYRLEVVRALDAVDEVAKTITSWHS